MKTRFFYLVFILSFFSFSVSSGQIHKRKWSLGISGTPLFELSSSGLNGALFVVQSELELTNNLIVGIKPYFAKTSEKTQFAYDLTTKRPVSLRQDSFTSFGANVELKIILLRTSLIKPYTALLLGGGYSNYAPLKRNVWGELVTSETRDFINSNKGIGLGTYFQISRSLKIDAKLMYTEVTANKEIEPSRYLCPTLGILKTL